MYDWFPTFLDAAGAKSPASVDGVSLLPSLTGKGKVNESRVYVEYFVEGQSPNYNEFGVNHRKRIRNQMQLTRSNQFVGVRYDIKSENDDFEIYDVVKDPAQRINLASAMSKLQNQMKNEVLQTRRVDSAAVRPYDNAFVPSLNKPVKPGISWVFKKGKFNWLSNYTSSLDKRNIAIDLKGINAQQLGEGIVSVTGFINIPKDGEYTFYLKPNSKAFLRIHKIGVIDADYATANNIQGKIKLKSGLHPFVFSYANSNEAPTLIWSSELITKEEIPSIILFN